METIYPDTYSSGKNVNICSSKLFCSPWCTFRYQTSTSVLCPMGTDLFYQQLAVLLYFFLTQSLSLSLSLSPHLLHSRHYEYSSSGESSPELPVLSKHPPHHPPPPPPPPPPPGGPPPPTRDRGGDSEPGTPPYYSGYNSAEEYEATHAPFFDLEVNLTHAVYTCQEKDALG